jgi:hypothetical protein
MAGSSPAPKIDAEEAEVLAQLDRVAAAVRAKAMPRVVERVQALAKQLASDPTELLKRQLRDDIEAIRQASRLGASSSITSEEIEAEIQQVRAARKR